MSPAAHATIQLDTQHPEGMRKIQALEERKPTAVPDDKEKVSPFKSHPFTRAALHISSGCSIVGILEETENIGHEGRLDDYLMVF